MKRITAIAISALLIITCLGTTVQAARRDSLLDDFLDYLFDDSDWDDYDWDDYDWDDLDWDDCDWDDYGFSDRDWDNLSWGDHDWDDFDWDDSEDEYHVNDTQVSEKELLSWNTGLGEAQYLDGDIVVVSMYMDDKYTSWDFDSDDDVSTIWDTFDYLTLATDWLTEQGQNWRKNPVFHYDWNEDDDLLYAGELNSDVTSDDDIYTEVCEFIDEYIDSDHLKAKYNADSIVFMTFFNTPYDNETVSFTYPYDDDMDYPYEICFITVSSDEEIESPAAYAHEMLHTFGAPDLYTSASPEYNYNIVNDFIEYCEFNYPNEIMLTTYDVDTYEPYYDRITNELTEITAYYIGWIDELPEVEEFNLQPSQYELTGFGL